MAMIAITTRSSIRVKPVNRRQEVRQPNEFAFAEPNLQELACKIFIAHYYTGIKAQEREITMAEFVAGDGGGRPKEFLGLECSLGIDRELTRLKWRRQGAQKIGRRFSKTIFAFSRTIGIIFSELGNLSISRLGRSSVESVFSDDLKPDGRERSGKKQSV